MQGTESGCDSCKWNGYQRHTCHCTEGHFRKASFGQAPDSGCMQFCPGKAAALYSVTFKGAMIIMYTCSLLFIAQGIP